MTTVAAPAKRSQRASIASSVSQLRKALENTEGNWTAVDRARMQRDLADRQRELARLDQELAAGAGDRSFAGLHGSCFSVGKGRKFITAARFWPNLWA